MKTPILLAAIAGLMAATPLAALAQQNVGPGSVFVTPVQPQPDEADGDELSTDLDFFVAAGYKVPDWDSWYKLRKQVASDLVIPDWVKRTGKLPPDDPLIEVTSVFITGGDFANTVVYSHLPGDCDDTGCLVQIYSMGPDKTWKKDIEFKALALAYKGPDDTGKSSVVAVGNVDVPNRIFDWNGFAFEERK